jgi:hypothetical protein
MRCSETMTELRGEAREVALAEVQAVRALSHDEKYAGLLAQVDEGDVADEELLESVLELGLQSGRIRALYGPGGEQAAIATLRRLPRGRVRGESARGVSEALQTLAGRPLDAVAVTAVAPGAFTLTIGAGGVEATIRLDGSGARLTSLGT